MSIYSLVYRRKGYKLSDAFRPDPKWGKRCFTVDSEKLGTDDFDAIKEAARLGADEGYELFSFTKCR